MSGARTPSDGPVLAAQDVRDAEFREGWRGYSPEEVDQFLDRVAEGFEVLQERVRTLQGQLADAETRAADDTDETVKRTLSLAQRAADLVVGEAKAVAERVVEESRELAGRLSAEAEGHAARVTAEVEAHAARLKAEAEAHASRLVADAESAAARRQAEAEVEVERRIAARLVEAEQSHRELVRRLTEERGSLEVQVESLRRDADVLRTVAHVGRERLRVVLAEQLAAVETLGMIGIVPGASAVGGEPHQPA